MSQPPPFVLPPEGRGARVRAVLAGAGRQRVAVALLALAALLGAGDRVGQGHAQAGRLPGRPGCGRAGGPDPAQGGARHALDDRAQGSGRGACGRSGPPTGPGPPARRQPGPRRHPGRGRRDRRRRPRRRQPRPPAHRRRTGPDPGSRRPRPTPPPGAAATPGVTPSAPLDLNTATLEQLDALPGVGEVTAGHILAYRSAHPFTTVDQLLEVPGIGQRRFDQLKDLVTVA